MVDKTTQIVEAATKIFVKKGFLQTTTQEIAKKANVAEITIYRKFSTKQNLFEFIVKKAFEEKLEMKVLKLARETKDTDIFFKRILIDRLDIMSRNESMMKMLISESLSGNLPDKINFTNLVFMNLRDGIQAHFEYLGRKDNAECYARQLGSILLGHIILPSSKFFYELDSNEKKLLIHKYIESIKGICQENTLTP